MSDSFRDVAPSIAFFRDGETVRAAKLGAIASGVQRGVAQLERALGDVHNVVGALPPLYQNSLGRAVGSMAALDVPFPRAAANDSGDPTLAGLACAPDLGTAADIAGRTGENLAGVSVGCLHDGGGFCRLGLDDRYMAFPDGRTPCREIGCPQFTGHRKVGQYLVVPPSGVPLPEEFGAAVVESVEGLVSLFDSTLNRGVPEGPAEWRATPLPAARARLFPNADFVGEWSDSLDVNGKLPIWFSGFCTPQAQLLQDYTGEPPQTSSLTRGTSLPRVVLSADRGEFAVLQRRATLDAGGEYVWTYTVRADCAEPLVHPSVGVEYGSVEIDAGNGYVQLVAGSGFGEYVQVSGTTLPGEVSWYAECDQAYWTFRRRLRCLTPTAGVVLSVGHHAGLNADHVDVRVQSFDLERQAPDAAVLRCVGPSPISPIWTGTARCSTVENLIQDSNNPGIWNQEYGSLFFKPDEIDAETGERAMQVISMDESAFGPFVDVEVAGSTLTWAFEAKSAAGSTVTAFLAADPVAASGTFALDSQWRTVSVTLSGIDVAANPVPKPLVISTNADFRIRRARLCHGDKVVPYVSTANGVVANYGRVFALEGGDRPLPANVTHFALAAFPTATCAGIGTTDATVHADSAAGVAFWPTHGVFAAAGSLFSYERRWGEILGDVRPAWGGARLAVPAAGSTMTLLPLPTEGGISGCTLTAGDVVPLRDGAWNEAFPVQLHDVSLDRFSLVSPSLPLARAAASLLAGFVEHVSDPDLHFRPDQLCVALLEVGKWMRTDDLDLDLAVGRTVPKEGVPVRVTARSYGMAAGDPKVLTLNWGDGTVETFDVDGSSFGPYAHAYMIPHSNADERHTIVARLEDVPLGIASTAAAAVTIKAAVKSVASAKAWIAASLSAAQSARTMVKVAKSAAQKSRAAITM